MGEAELAAEIENLFQKNEAPKEVKDPLGELKRELSNYLADMKGIRQRHSEDAMSWLSSVSARALEMIYVTLQSESRSATKFRIEWLLPFKEECKFQFQILSRRHSLETFEYQLAGGQAT